MRELNLDMRRAKYLYHKFQYDICMEFGEFLDRFRDTIGPKQCDVISAGKTYRADFYCAPGGCPHYGNCLPIDGIRDTPDDAIGKARDKAALLQDIHL